MDELTKLRGTDTFGAIKPGSVKIPRRLNEAEEDGLVWGSCFVAQRLGDIQELGTLSKNATNKHIKNKLIDNINRGALTVSTIKFHRDYKTMEHMFYGHHPSNSLRNEMGLFKNFMKLLKAKFGKIYDDQVLYLITKVFSYFRVRTINQLAKPKTKKPKKIPKVEAAKKRKLEGKKAPRQNPTQLREKLQLVARGHYQ